YPEVKLLLRDTHYRDVPKRDYDRRNELIVRNSYYSDLTLKVSKNAQLARDFYNEQKKMQSEDDYLERVSKSRQIPAQPKLPQQPNYMHVGRARDPPVTPSFNPDPPPPPIAPPKVRPLNPTSKNVDTVSMGTGM